MRQKLEITEQDANIRVDVFLTERFPDLSRSHVQKLMATHLVWINGDVAKPSWKTKPGDEIEVDIPAAVPLTKALPENIPLDIVFEDDDLVVVNKAKGMVVHPAPGAETGTLVNALLYHCPRLSGIGGVMRPGIVHRLDRETTGLLVVAKTDAAHHSLSDQIRHRTATRKYQALLWGKTPFKHAVIDAPIARHPVDRKRMTVYEDADTMTQHPRRMIDAMLPDQVQGLGLDEILGAGGEAHIGGLRDGGARIARAAVTEIRLLEHLACFSWIEAILQTGRTHQIRVHTAFAGFPVVGDVVYGGMRRMSADQIRGPLLSQLNGMIAKLHGQALHAYSLSFTHPRSGVRMQFHAPLPQEIAELVDLLRRIDEN